MKKFIELKTEFNSNIDFKKLWAKATKSAGKFLFSALLGFCIHLVNPSAIKNQKPDAQTTAPASSPTSSPAPKKPAPKPKKKPKNHKCRASKK